MSELGASAKEPSDGAPSETFSPTEMRRARRAAALNQSCRHTRLSVVGHYMQQPACGARGVGGAQCVDVHLRKHARVGRCLEREGTCERLLRCTKRGLKHKRAGAARGYSRTTRFASLNVRAK
jgi:hypothetical protein